MTEIRRIGTSETLLLSPAALRIPEKTFFGRLVDELPGFEVEWKAILGKKANLKQVLKDIRGFYMRSKTTVFSLFLPNNIHFLPSKTIITKYKEAGEAVSRLNRDDGSEVIRKKTKGRVVDGVNIRREIKNEVTLIEDTGDALEDKLVTESEKTDYKKIEREKRVIAVKSSVSNRVFIISVDSRTQEDADGVWKPLPKRIQIEYKGTVNENSGNHQAPAILATDQDKLADNIAIEIATIRDEIKGFIPYYN